MAIKKLTALFSKGADVPKVAVPVKAVAAKKTSVKKAVAKSTATKAVGTKPVVAKKAVVKKTVTVPKVAAKKAAPKKTAAKRLVVASDSESFWVNDGQVLNSLIALEDAFKTMKPTTFKHHMTKDGNHFAEWVEAVLMDAECALALRSAKNATAAHIIISKHLKTYGK